MKKHLSILLAVLFVASGASVLVRSQTHPTTQTLMKAKTGYAHRLLDAVVLEEFEVMKDQAFRLKAVAETADWNVATSPAFVRESEAFIRASDRLLEAAREEDGDAAALAYVDVTLSCVHCHRLIRESP